MWAPSGEIECAAHGARFDPATGGCKGGPCDGRALTPLEVREQDGALWLAAARI
jgi:nitrite reductase/ring-hydroxylating ferredoxin subunit